MSKPVVAPQITLEYVGPDREESPVFGTLVAGERYQAEAGFGEYLLKTHPSHWTRPAPAVLPVATEKE